MADTELRDIELRLERMHNALTRQEEELSSWRSSSLASEAAMQNALSRQEEELSSWRERSARLPNWIRNGGITMCIVLFGQSMTAVWWASEITNTQQNMLADVKVNTEYRIASTERYNDIMIEIVKIQVMMDNHFNRENIYLNRE